MSLLSKLGFFQIENHLGSGAYTDSYQAIDTIRRRTVALKVLRPEAARLSAFLDQAALASELVHPHIAWLWETGEEENAYYLAERFIDGPSLDQALAETGPISWTQAETILQQTAKALEFAHAHGWTHGDLRPGKILVSEELGAVLRDFALNKARRAAGEGDFDLHTFGAGLHPARGMGWGSPRSTGGPVCPRLRTGRAADRHTTFCAAHPGGDTRPPHGPTRTTRHIPTRRPPRIELGFSDRAIQGSKPPLPWRPILR